MGLQKVKKAEAAVSSRLAKGGVRTLESVLEAHFAANPYARIHQTSLMKEFGVSRSRFDGVRNALRRRYGLSPLYLKQKELLFKEFSEAKSGNKLEIFFLLYKLWEETHVVHGPELVMHAADNFSAVTGKPVLLGWANMSGLNSSKKLEKSFIKYKETGRYVGSRKSKLFSYGKAELKGRIKKLSASIKHLEGVKSKEGLATVNTLKNSLYKYQLLYVALGKKK